MHLQSPPAQNDERGSTDLHCAGEDILVARNGHPVARLSAVRQREGGFMRGEIVVRDADWWKADDQLADDFGT